VKAHINRSTLIRLALIASLIVHLVTMSTRLHADSGSCGGATTTVPFTDVAGSIFFCSIAEAFFSGLTNGTTSTTYSPSQNVPRDQMAAFITRTLDQSLTRGSRRAALNQWWTPQGPSSIPTTPTGSDPVAVASDGADLWVVNEHGSIVRVRASDRKLLSTFTAPGFGSSVLVARGLIYAARHSQSGTEDLYSIDPAQTGGAATFVVKTGEDISVTFDQAGVYGVKCLPHYGMGMVAMIVVGTPTNIDQAKAVPQVGKAKQVFTTLFEKLEASKTAAR